MKKCTIILFLFSMTGLVYSQKRNLTPIEKQVAGRWGDMGDSTHILTLDGGEFQEYHVKFMANSKSDTIHGLFHVEYAPLRAISPVDTVGTNYVLYFTPANNGNLEYKERIIMLDRGYLEIATWKGGPYLFRIKR